MFLTGLGESNSAAYMGYVLRHRITTVWYFYMNVLKVLTCEKLLVIANHYVMYVAVVGRDQRKELSAYSKRFLIVEV